MLGRLRTYLSQMFMPDQYTAEGFRITGNKYFGPEHTVNLPGNEKRTVTICNLFSKQNKRIDEIAELLDTTRRVVISGLIHEGLILERRVSNRSPRYEKDRRQSIICPGFFRPAKLMNCALSMESSEQKQ